MTESIKKSFRLGVPSLILLLLPYLLAQSRNIIHSPVFSVTEFLLILAGLAAIHFLITAGFDAEKNKYKYVAIATYLIFFLVFYTADITDYLVQLEFRFFGKPLIKLRWLTALTILILFASLFYFIKRSVNWVKFQNTIFLLLGCIGFVNIGLAPKKKVKADIYQNAFFELPPTKSVNAPVCLLILDGYSSPEELFKHVQDSGLFDFSKKLTQNGWIVRNSIPSKHIYTEISLSSLFNYNLSEKQDYEQAMWTNTPYSRFKHALLADSLSAKNVRIENLGIFPLGKTQPISRIYFYPINTFELVIARTFLSQVVSYLSCVNMGEIRLDFYPSHIHNQNILNELKEKKPTENNFIYGHLFMPHRPYYFGDEFPYLDANFDNYIKFWKFTGNKIQSTIEHLTKKNYKVIVASDHGYRLDERINKRNSFAAFYGFDSTSVESIKSVQDIGSLINGQFSK